jgi:hypothetical protein
LAEAVAWTVGVRLESLLLVVDVLIGLVQPALWDECVGVLEVRGRVEGGVQRDGDGNLFVMLLVLKYINLELCFAICVGMGIEKVKLSFFRTSSMYFLYCPQSANTSHLR